MKTYIYNKYRYVALFLAFSLVFCATAFLLSYIGACIDGQKVSLDANTDINIDAYPVTVVIDPGHGGEDGGTIGINGIYEKDLNLRIALIMYDILRANGINAVLTRDTDILLYDKNSDHRGKKKIQDLAKRREIAEQQQNTLFVSIHMNAFPSDKYSGLQVYYSKNHEDSKLLAESITEHSRKTLLPNNKRNPKEAGDNIYLLDTLKCPAVLVECGFLSNREECELLCDNTYQKKMALCLCVSIMEHIDLIHG